MAIGGTYKDSRFGQFADPNFGASLGAPGAGGGGSSVLPGPTTSPLEGGSASDSGDTAWSPSASKNTFGYDATPGHQAFQDYGGYQDYYNKFDSAGGNTVRGGKITNLGTRQWGENEIDPLTGKLGWQQNAKDVQSMSMAEGGVIPGPDDEDQDSGNAAPPDTNPFGIVQSALSYGRKKFALPESFFGDANAATQSGGVQGSDDTQSFAEGGEVEDTNEGVIPQEGAQDGAQGEGPDQGQAPDQQAVMGYLQGAGGVGPEIAAALEQRVDPQGQMDPSERKLKALSAAGSPDKAFSVMQHYRQKFNAYGSFAKAALQGAGGRPPNPAAAADALNKAYEHVPDGNSMRFTPTQGGMQVAIKTIPSKPAGPGGDQPNPDAGPVKTQMFAEGGEVDDEPSYDPSQDPMGVGQSVEQGDVVGGEAAPMDQQQAPAPITLTPQQLIQWQQKDGQFDSMVEGKGQKALEAMSAMNPMKTAGAVAEGNGPPTQAADTTPKASFPSPVRNPQGFGAALGTQGAKEKVTLADVLHEIDQSYSVGQSQQRSQARAAAYQHFMDNATKVEAEQTKSTHADKRAEIAAGARRDVAGTNAGAKIASTTIAQEHGDTRAGQKFDTQREIAGANRDVKVSEGEKNRVAAMERTIVTNKPAVLGSQDAMNKARGAVAPQQPVTTQQPSQADILFLRANPDAAAKFDKRFGAGASQRVLDGQ